MRMVKGWVGQAEWGAQLEHTNALDCQRWLAGKQDQMMQLLGARSPGRRLTCPGDGRQQSQHWIEIDRRVI